MKLLSIIIPYYNAGQYLPRCLDSCTNQGIASEHYEIIICDDGSDAEHLAAAQAAAQQHPNIALLSQPHAGPGMARNRGLDHAQGAYVTFVDSDDYLHPHALAPLLEQCRQQRLDVCKFAMQCHHLSAHLNELRSYQVSTSTILTGSQAIANPHIPLDTACSAIYDKQFLQQNNIRFTTLTTAEDVAFTLEVYLHAQRIMFSNTPAYVYEIKRGSRGLPTDPDGRLAFAANDLTIAAMLRKHADDTRLPTSTRQALTKRCNSATISALWWLKDQRRSLRRDQLSRLLDHGRQLGVYPLKGLALTWRSTLLAHCLLNRKRVFLRFFAKK